MPCLRRRRKQSLIDDSPHAKVPTFFSGKEFMLEAIDVLKGVGSISLAVRRLGLTARVR